MPMTDKIYYTISEAVRYEIKVKRSTFIGSISPAKDRETAEMIISEIRNEFHDAAHNCFAYRIDENIFRFSDDGEPSSTAGRPILSMLDKYRLLQSVLVVTRYFGGTKLGIGGLISAYSKAAEETIQKSKKQKLLHYVLFTIRYPYKLTRQVEYLVGKYQGLPVDAQFAEAVTSRIKIPCRNRDVFMQELNQSGSGQIHLIDEQA